ncbi:hypothetical protein HMPREF0555_1192 [Leuconostoc mesenteroides subsp. cremoris ATCC 19254]|uniref:Uncharacterized protein n=1 Tax=Leuconostoc mesenteroides subsp. cremoris ATCC 19254 TaxID=586220 RepID=C2KKM6_LEUMC|nr:hypothetical protein HMPREF0555_1192 [Leuconostoc mesenteroides subsp. cremoris ATCC 19254]
MCDIPIAIKANPIKAATTEALCVGQKSIRAPKIIDTIASNPIILRSFFKKYV